MCGATVPWRAPCYSPDERNHDPRSANRSCGAMRRDRSAAPLRNTTSSDANTSCCVRGSSGSLHAKLGRGRPSTSRSAAPYLRRAVPRPTCTAPRRPPSGTSSAPTLASVAVRRSPPQRSDGSVSSGSTLRHPLPTRWVHGNRSANAPRHGTDLPPATVRSPHGLPVRRQERRSATRDRRLGSPLPRGVRGWRRGERPRREWLAGLGQSTSGGP